MVNIFHDRCQRRRYAKSDCALCAEACPAAGCVTFEGASVVVDSSVCVGCGICTTACPTGALELKGLPEKGLLEKLQSCSESPDGNIPDLNFDCGLGPGGGSLEILSNNSPPGTTLVRIPCLAMLKESHLAALILSGVKAITLHAGRCPQCSFSEGRKIIGKTVTYARNIIEGAGISASISIDSEMPEPVGRGLFSRKGGRKTREISASPELSRRELFTFFKEKAKESAKEKILGYTKGQKEVCTPDEVPPRRSILLDALNRLNLQNFSNFKEGGFPAHNIRISERCSACGRCEAFCPTGAIKRTGMDGEARIEFCQALCMGCHKCGEFCPEGALGYDAEMHLEDFVRGKTRVVFKRAFTECAVCGETYFPEAGGRGPEPRSCPTCAKREKTDRKLLSLLFRNENSPL
ncbi:MAG: 4Fe-4S binding protein [Deltaproteobacteria bacterium]|nr:4Fe-4S binding protein [Deltaproteobacteria bacterium]